MKRFLRSRLRSIQTYLVLTAISGLVITYGLVSVADGQVSRFRDARYDTESYWRSACVVLAKVTAVRQAKSGAAPKGELGLGQAGNAPAQYAVPAGTVIQDQVPESEDTIVIQPLGTLSGEFDAGENSQAIIRGLHAAQEVHAGDTILVALCNSPAYFATSRKRFSYAIDNGPYPYMNDECNGIEPVTGFSDPNVQLALAVIQDLRRKPAVAVAHGARYWERHSVAYAELRHVGNSGDNRRQQYEFQIRGTVSGTYDAGALPNFCCEFAPKELELLLDERVVGVDAGDTFLLLLERDETGKNWHVPGQRAGFMPRTHDPISRASTIYDAVHATSQRCDAIDSALIEIQRLRRGDVAPAVGSAR